MEKTKYQALVKNYAKTFYSACLMFTVFLVVMFYKKHTIYSDHFSTFRIKFSFPEQTKKILLWIPHKCYDCAPLGIFRNGNAVFKSNKCEYQNCYVVSTRKKAENVSEDQYDAIIFNGRPILRMKISDLPKKRHQRQRYIFLQQESEFRYPVCQAYFDNFFNWTMTYRLDSDLPWPYFIIRNINNEMIGPKVHMKWEKNMMPISENLKERLTRKEKLVAWFVSNCHDQSGRLKFARKLQKALKRYNQTVDIYGHCGHLKCPRNESAHCNDYIEKNYKFYLAFENSFAGDYVTEKLLTAVQHNAVPIVYGGADYQRFLPPNSYIDARLLGADKLAETMVAYSRNMTVFQSLFKWHNYYFYEDNKRSGHFACQLCKKLNEDREPYVYKDFRKWWSKGYKRRCKTN